MQIIDFRSKTAEIIKAILVLNRLIIFGVGHK